MTHELAPWLLRLTVFTSLALLLTLALRQPARRLFGARLAYQVWLIVPLVTIVAWLPTRTAPHVQQVVALRKARLLALHMAPAPSPGFDVVMWCWAAGALALACWFIYAHGAFRRAAGVLQPAGGVLVSRGNCGPASVGLFTPVIVVPHDFTAQYSTAEQALIIAHERVHIVRRDAFANLLQAAFQCAFWFSPLVHIAALYFRRDQELACDAVVMAQHPRQRRTYAEALLKSHTSSAWPHSTVNGHWQTHHPTKERLMQLQSMPPGPSRRFAGRLFTGMLAAGAIFATLSVRAEQPATTYAVAMTVDADGAQSAPRVLTKEGQQFAVASGAWRVEMTVRAAKTPGDLWVAGKVYKHEKIVGAPTLLAHVNEKVGIKVADGDDPFALSMVVAPQP